MAAAVPCRMASVSEELEIKYDADADVEVWSLLGAVVESEEEVFLEDGDRVDARLEATYFDTVDHRLARAHLTVRRRTGGADEGWHLKVPGPDGARAEVRLPAGRAVKTVPAELRRMVRVRTGGKALVPVARITTDRTVWHLVEEAGRVLVEVADDRVVGQRLRRPSSADREPVDGSVQWREVEIELVHGERELLEAIDARLRDLGLQVASSRSKLARVLGDDMEAMPPGEKQELSPKSASGGVVMAYLAGQVEQVLAYDPLVRVDRPDSVHKMRVASRRLRSALKTYQPLFDTEAVRPLRVELKWLAGRLGVARDAEVLRERLGESVGAEGDHASGGPVAAGVDEEMSQAYRSAHDDLLVDLDADRYHRLVEALHALVSTPPFTEPASGSAAEVLPARVAKTYKALKAEVKAAYAAPSGAERSHHLHEARKAAKRARYAAEALSEAFGKEPAAFAGAMEDLQEELGEHQDSVVMRERLLGLARRATTPAEGFTYGRLHAREEARGERSQERFGSAWKASSKKSLRRWFG